MSFHSKLTALLQTAPRFVDDEGELISEIDDAMFKVNREDKDLNRRFYGQELAFPE